MAHSESMPMQPLPYLTPRSLKTGGTLKSVPEDFVVEEVPTYLPCGDGEHLFVWIEKRDVSAEFLVSHIARTTGISRNEIGVAGMKDRRAVTRQWVSLPASAESRIDNARRDDIQILKTVRHTNKLRTGHLRGNRFEILLRDVIDGDVEDAAEIAQQIAAVIAIRGVPNYYGTQRFGIDGNTLETGLKLLRGEMSPAKIPFKKRKFLLKLALSAVQSELFNRVLAKRIELSLSHTVTTGDVLQVCESGGLFLVDDPQAEQQRLDAGEVVLAGPMFGPKMKCSTGPSAELEQAVLAELALTESVFEKFKKQAPGARRPLFIFPQSLQITSELQGLRFHFELPSGAYATTLLREFMKTE